MSIAAESYAFYNSRIPRTPDELPATDMWERRCMECPAIVQGGQNALYAHLCLVHPDVVDYMLGLTDEEFAQFAATGVRPTPKRRRRHLRAVPGAPVQGTLFDLDPKDPTP